MSSSSFTSSCSSILRVNLSTLRSNIVRFRCDWSAGCFTLSFRIIRDLQKRFLVIFQIGDARSGNSRASSFKFQPQVCLFGFMFVISGKNMIDFGIFLQVSCGIQRDDNGRRIWRRRTLVSKKLSSYCLKLTFKVFFIFMSKSGIKNLMTVSLSPLWDFAEKSTLLGTHNTRKHYSCPFLVLALVDRVSILYQEFSECRLQWCSLLLSMKL